MKKKARFWNLNQTKVRIILFCYIVLVFLVSACEETRKEELKSGFGYLKVSFMYDGRAVPGTLTVSDGKFRKRWTEVKTIDAEVPVVATYIIDAKLPWNSSSLPISFRDIIPELHVPEHATREIIIHLLQPGEPKPFNPVVLIEDVGAQAKVKNTIERELGRPGWLRLRSDIRGNADKSVILDGIYRDPDDSPDSTRAFTCGDGCPHIYPADCSVYCYGCSSTSVSSGDHWKGNVNLCSFTIPTLPSTAPIESEFEVLTAQTGGVHLAAALRHDSIVRPIHAELVNDKKRMVLEPPLKKRSYPDFVTEVGSYRYIVKVPGAYTNYFENYKIPIDVKDGKITQVFMQLPTEELKELEPVVLGDTRLGVAKRVVRTESGSDTLSVVVTVEDPDPGIAWILLPLPSGTKVREVLDRYTGNSLVDGLDYLSDEFSGIPTLTVRTQGNHDSFRVTWETD